MVVVDLFFDMCFILGGSLCDVVDDVDFGL